FHRYNLETVRPVITVSNETQYNIIHLEAEKPIVVYCFFAVKQSCEAWTPIPVEQWGLEYNVAATPGSFVNDIGIAGEVSVPLYPKPAPAEFMIIAAYDNTNVDIEDFGRTLVGRDGHPLPGTQRRITLSANQCYQFQSYIDSSKKADSTGSRWPSSDIAGVRIRGDKPIGVISGNTRTARAAAESPLGNNVYKNMLMEWLPPSEQLGTEFVYLPTWDSHRPGINAPAERGGEYVRVYSRDASPLKGYYRQPGAASTVNFSVARDTMSEFFYGEAQAVYFKTESPAMAMMNSSAITHLDGSTPCFGGIPCLSYSAWAPYMVDLTPREQWTTFAPYYAPNTVGSMQHYINVVCDTSDQKNIYTEQGTPFLFMRKIPGTGLIWGSQSISAGQDHYLEGKNGARFSGFVYGLLAGSEQYKPGPGRNRKGDDGSILGGDREGSATALVPAQYEEYSALSYGYPLVPERRVLKDADILQIDTVMVCPKLHISIRALNPDPAGLRSISIDPSSVINAKLVPIDPASMADIIGKNHATVDIVPVNPLKDAVATIIIKDRTGKIWYIYYSYQAEYLDMDKDSVNFGEVTKGQSMTTTVTFTNPLPRDVKVYDMKLTSGRDGFTIVSTDPAPPVTLKPGETIKVVVRIDANIDNKLYEDSLKVMLGCVSIAIGFSAETVQPMITINDADFGFMVESDPVKAKQIDICNIGRGFIRFRPDTSNAASPDVLTWLERNFTVPQSTLDSLKSMQLGVNECFHFYVYFDPSKSGTGTFETVARAWATTRTIKDLSKWKAVVTGKSGVEDAASGSGYRLDEARPNPSSGKTEIRYRLGAPGLVNVAIYDAAGKLVAGLVDAARSAGEERVTWDASGVASGVYYCRIRSGSWSAARSIVVAR
ncbi:MAG: T9SS type A sorting domain-containing protein, partial [Candidatus Kapaibacterium sp.]